MNMDTYDSIHTANFKLKMTAILPNTIPTQVQIICYMVVTSDNDFNLTTIAPHRVRRHTGVHTNTRSIGCNDSEIAIQLHSIPVLSQSAGRGPLHHGGGLPLRGAGEGEALAKSGCDRYGWVRDVDRWSICERRKKETVFFRTLNTPFIFCL